ncbi:hypothetical protein GY45DRAFT_1251451 [Cubamyces sp. BRFM 1775]|nr:hypothetical protein GY45DRAFT_1251451 [Cubamyces sp. BRFM 1775]
MSSYTYVDTPNANLVCCICRAPFVEPCTTQTCYHTFCYDCISQAIAINTHCPIDRTPLSIQDLAPADPVIRNLVDELLVKCPHEYLGCSYTCQRLLMPIHIRDTCQYVQVDCPNSECNRRLLRKDVAGHCCGDVPTKDTSTEPQQPADEQRNSQEGPTTDIAQQACSLLCAALAAENSVLRLRLSALENVVHSLRNEMFAVKHALGPWYRPEVQYQLHQQDDAQHSLHESPLESPESSSPVDVATYPPTSVPESIPPTPVGDPADIASYFPPADDDRNVDVRTRLRRTRASTDARHAHSAPSTSRTQASASPSAQTALYTSMPGAYPHGALYTQGGTYATPGLAQGASYAPGASLSASTPATVSIPPLDPTTPLPDTLASLHSSLVTLAGALGALGAARGSESLRTTEELRGIRGAMHALRMQVHDILTSRTHLANPGSNAAVGGGSGDSDAPDGPPGGMGTPAWPGYAPRPYGHLPMYPHLFPPPHLGMPHVPPTNITKL